MFTRALLRNTSRHSLSFASSPSFASTSSRRAFSSIPKGTPLGPPKTSDKTTNALKTPVSWKGLVVAALFSFGAAGFYNLEHEKKTKKTTAKVTTTGRPNLGGDWSLVEAESGKFVTNKTYEGEYTILYFGFAHCPDICPSELRKLSSVIEGMKGEVDLRGLFVTVDPARDSIDNLLTYKKDFHPSITYLTGTPEMIKKMAALYRVYISKADETDDGDYLVDHSIVLYLVGPDGKFRDFFTQGMKASDVVSKIRKTMDEDKKE